MPITSVVGVKLSGRVSTRAHATRKQERALNFQPRIVNQSDTRTNFSTASASRFCLNVLPVEILEQVFLCLPCQDIVKMEAGGGHLNAIAC